MHAQGPISAGARAVAGEAGLSGLGRLGCMQEELANSSTTKKRVQSERWHAGTRAAKCMYLAIRRKVAENKHAQKKMEGRVGEDDDQEIGRLGRLSQSKTGTLLITCMPDTSEATYNPLFLQPKPSAGPREFGGWFSFMLSGTALPSSVPSAAGGHARRPSLRHFLSYCTRSRSAKCRRRRLFCRRRVTASDRTTVAHPAPMHLKSTPSLQTTKPSGLSDTLAGRLAGPHDSPYEMPACPPPEATLKIHRPISTRRTQQVVSEAEDKLQWPASARMSDTVDPPGTIWYSRFSDVEPKEWEDSQLQEMLCTSSWRRGSRCNTIMKARGEEVDHRRW
ncbi:hypothetical protein Q7P37_008312 [Cladosporium fusiforme]